MIPEYWLHEAIQNPSILKHFFYSLSGQQVQIIFPGRWSPAEGPDFQEAILNIDGTRIQGDIEVHRTLDEWFRHGHHLDSRYHNVILHILMERPSHIPPELQQRFLHVLFPEMLAIPFSQWVAHMEQRHLFKSHYMTLSTQKVPRLSCLQSLALHRFLRKTRRIADWHHFFTPEEMVFIGIAEALGYPHNKSAFSRLVWSMPPTRLFRLPHLFQNPATLFLFFYYLSGFPLPSQYTPLVRRWKTDGYFPLLEPSQWHFGRQRPNNRPLFRLAALTTLIGLSHHLPRGLFYQLHQEVEQRLSLPELLKRWRKWLIRPWPAQLYQLIREAFTTPLPASVKTMGMQRFHQLTINILLPLFYWWALRNQSPGFAEYIMGLYETYRMPPDSRILQRWTHRVRKTDPSLAQALNTQAYIQQGFYEWVTHHNRATLLCPTA